MNKLIKTNHKWVLKILQVQIQTCIKLTSTKQLRRLVRDSHQVLILASQKRKETTSCLSALGQLCRESRRSQSSWAITTTQRSMEFQTIKVDSEALIQSDLTTKKSDQSQVTTTLSRFSTNNSTQTLRLVISIRALTLVSSFFNSARWFSLKKQIEDRAWCLFVKVKPKSKLNLIMFQMMRFNLNQNPKFHQQFQFKIWMMQADQLILKNKSKKKIKNMLLIYNWL